MGKDTPAKARCLCRFKSTGWLFQAGAMDCGSLLPLSPASLLARHALWAVPAFRRRIVGPSDPAPFDPDGSARRLLRQQAGEGKRQQAAAVRGAPRGIVLPIP
jgi:hypothetical protein